VLEQAAADADVRLSELELLGEAEREQVVEAWNRTEAAYSADRCIHELFEAQAARTPGAVAVVFEEESLTYAELDARANRLAHHLAGLGAGPEARVGICVDRSAEMVVAMLAVLKSGAAYLPLDPSYPAGRLAYMLKDSGAPLLVTQGSLRGLLPTDGVRIVSVDEDAAAIASNSADAPRSPVDAANAAYVIYTSGSTGQPKGVQVTHGNAVSFFAGMDERVGGSAAGTWLAVTRISFDIHVLELLWTLARGFRVVVQPEPDRARDGESIAEQLRRHAVTHLQCTPSLAAMMIAESGTGALAGLERILLGGEALPSELAAQVTAVLPNGLVNMYGPTETTVWSATHAVEVVEGLVPIGRPIANTREDVLETPYQAPRTPLEETIAAIWAEVLGVDQVGVHDRFFDLGGHSLLLVRAQARLREAFGQPVPITHLFRYLTVSALAAALDAPAPGPAAAPEDDARVRTGRHRLRARGRAGVTGSRDEG
jgi:amino acid adenylation domain-containing protein